MHRKDTIFVKRIASQLHGTVNNLGTGGENGFEEVDGHSNESEYDEVTKIFDQFCMKFPQFDLSQWSLRFQLSTFINDLQDGLTLKNALNRFQTIKAMMESKMAAFTTRRSCNEEENVDASLEPIAVCKANEPEEIIMFHNIILAKVKHGDATVSGEAVESNSGTCDELHGLIKWDETLANQKQLRERIKKIQGLESVSVSTKSKMVQTLMMGQFAASNLSFYTSNADVLQLKSSGRNHKKDQVVIRNCIADDTQTPDQISEEPLPTPDDLTPTKHPSGAYGCPHYMRNCKLKCPTCHKWFTCRFCHDESDSTHIFQQARTEWIMCMLCNKVQKPNSADCEGCGHDFAIYFCKECVLYDNDEMKDIYHCAKCKICRLGLGLGQDFFHCDGCHACLSIELQGKHRCIERSTMSNCPICGEYMFTSIKPVVYMSICGHAIHQHCFNEHTRHSYKCPECQVTVLNMETKFRLMDKEVEEQPLPEPYCFWKCLIHCNDCSSRSISPYHIIGLRCTLCLSYNTIQLNLIKPGEDDSESPRTDQYSTSLAGAQLHLDPHSDTRQKLLRANFQRETVQPFIDLDGHDYFRNMVDMDQYMDKYLDFHPNPVSRDLDHSLTPKTTSTHEHLGIRATLTQKVKQFMADRPESPSWTELTDAFRRFIETSMKGTTEEEPSNHYSNNLDHNNHFETNPNHSTDSVSAHHTQQSKSRVDLTAYSSLTT